MALEARDTQARLRRAPIFRRVELLLRERGDQEPQPVELLRIEDAVEELVVIVGRDELSLGDVAEVRARGQVDRGRKLRQEMVGQVKVEIEPCQVSLCLLLDLIDVELREEHTALGVIGVRQRHEALREEVLLVNFLRCHLAERLPRDAPLQLDAGTGLDRLAARHDDAPVRPIAQVVAHLEQFLLAAHDVGLGPFHALHGGLKRLLDDHRPVAGLFFFILARRSQHGSAQQAEDRNPGHRAPDFLSRHGLLFLSCLPRCGLEVRVVSCVH